jgi:protein Mpv17
MPFQRQIAHLFASISKTLVVNSVRLKFRENKQKLFTKYLLYTNVCIAVSFGGLGDLIEQAYEIQVGHQKKWDEQRTLQLASTGVPVGLVCHNWYMLLDRFLPVRNGKNLIKKIVLDQCIASPIYICLFFIIVSSARALRFL